MKKLLFAIPSNTSGGAERVMTSVVNYAASQGYEVSFVNFDTDSSFYPISTKVSVIKLGIGFDGKSGLKKVLLAPYIEARRLSAAKKLLKSEKPDVVIAFLKTAEMLFGMAAIQLGIPFISSIRNEYTAYKGTLNMFRKWAYPKAKLIICQSEQVQSSLLSEIKCNTVVLPNPIAPDAVNSNNYLGKVRSKRIISVGRLCSQKNFELLIRAMSCVYQEHPEFQEYAVDIYGQGEDSDKLNKLIEEIGVSDLIKLRGVVPNALAANNNAALYVMASDFEGFPNTLIEAMANGIPAISTDFPSGIARELIGANDERGILVEVGNEEQLKNAIVSVLQNANQAEERAQKAFENSKQFELDAVCSRWLMEIEKSL